MSSSVTSIALLHHGIAPAALGSVAGSTWWTDAGVRLCVSPLLEDAPAQDIALLLTDVDDSVDLDTIARAIERAAQRQPVLVSAALVRRLPAVADRVGVQAATATPEHEIRVRPEPGVDPRQMDDLLLPGRLALADKVADDVRVLATANVGYADYPAVTFRPATDLGALLVDLDPQALADRDTRRFVRHLAHAIAGAPEPDDVRVGMVGYGAIGHEHARAVTAVPGLTLSAVSDPNPARVDVARTVASDVRTFTDSTALLSDDAVDLVVISTPPNTHAQWARQALEAGKHVVLEKPMALTTAECDDVMAQAEAAQRLLVVYQNRRFDADYRVMRRLVADGVVGEVFHVESFVGGYSHPCNYWHSDAAVSGGAIFDWGSHYIDQLLDLMPGDIAHVSASNHKRVWHDVTNADHSRVTIQFSDGRQADFIHSDLAAAPKPKWWVLGTRGAVRGDWRSERVVARTAIGTLDEDVLAPADSPALMSLHAPDGSVTSLAVPPAPAFAFHRELADHLLRGLPMSVEAAQSRRVVAVMEAAERSAAAGSTPVPLP